MPRNRKYAELVEDEAAKAEAEDLDDDEDTDAEPVEDAPPDEVAADPDAEPEAEPEPMSAEARAAALEALLDTYHGAAAQLFADEWSDAENCAMCGGLGFVFSEGLVQDETTQRCDRCKGHGVLLTESQVDQNRARQCPDCMGNGYVPRVVPPVVELTQTPPTYAPPPSNAATSTPAPVQIPPMPVYDPQAGVWRDPTTNGILTPQAQSAGSGATPAAVAS